MKKIVTIVIGLLFIAGCYASYKYYNDTYKAYTAYAIVPSEVPVKLQTKDSNGDKIDGWSSYNYLLTFVKENGDTQELAYELSSENPTPFEPGSYVTAEISKKRVVKGPNRISEEQIPTTIVSLLKDPK